MKNAFSKIWLGAAFLFLLFSKNEVAAQGTNPVHQQPQMAAHQPGNCITPEQYAKLRAEVEANEKRLRAEGVLPPLAQLTIPNVAPRFAWPLRVEPWFRGFEPFYITNYPDHDPDANEIQDFNCGTRTYDTHRGTDIAIAPHWWNLMAEGSVDVVAAEAGVITDRNDGAFDQNCPPLNLNVAIPVNFIVITHADGTRALYWHLQIGSVTGKTVGETVLAGEYLGRVGSSGNSTGPHLHFEFQQSNGSTLDPWQGNCNDWNTGSAWLVQKPYVDPAVLDMYTAGAAVAWGASCPNPDNTSLVNHFSQNQTVFFDVAFRDISNGQTATIKVFRPDGTPFQTFNYTHTDPFAMWDFRWWSQFIGNEPLGTWRWETTFNGKVYVKFFTIGCTGTELVSLPTSISGRKGWIAGNTVLAGTTVPLTACTVGATSTVRFEAGVDVLLGPETWVKKGADFRATIDPCSIGGQ